MMSLLLSTLFFLKFFDLLISSVLVLILDFEHRVYLEPFFVD